MKISRFHLRSIFGFLSDYKWRFTPYMYAKLIRSDLNQISKGIEIPSTELDKQLRSVLEALSAALPDINFARPTESDRVIVNTVLEKVLGFRLSRKPSNIPDCGRGIFVEKGTISPGSVVSLYPGTIYNVGDSILLQSIGNSFILRCGDGVCIDGNDRRLSAFLHSSCSRRDGLYDTTWMKQRPLNYLNMGQYVNNHNNEYPANVQYMDLDITGWPYRLRPWLPYAVYRPSNTVPLRTVSLVSTREISQGEELFSSYIHR